MQKTLLLCLALVAARGCAPPSAHDADTPLTVDRIVLLMRHGVRPPTKSPPMKPGIASDPWPNWDVPPGYLTHHGAAAIRLVGAFDARVLAAGLVSGDCPAPGEVAVYSDSDQRTIATGDAWISGFAPGCSISNQHKAQNAPDPIFSPLDSSGVAYDSARAEAAVAAELGTGGIAAVEAQQHDVLARLDEIYCGPDRKPGCGFSDKPTRLDPPRPGKKPSFAGALDLGSTAGQILLLEYADGKPMTEVGWGRASKSDIRLAGRLHAVEYSVLGRPPYVAASNSALVVPKMLDWLTTPNRLRFGVIVGHDTQLAALAGLLDLHWQVPGFAADDPSPGEAIGFERLHDRAGRTFVRVVLRAQGLDQIRYLTKLDEQAPATVAVLPIPDCKDPCPLGRFEEIVHARLSKGH